MDIENSKTDQDLKTPKDPFKELPVKDFSYINDPKQKPPKKSKPRTFLYVLIFFLVIILIGLFIFLYKNYKHQSTANNVQNTTQKSSKQSVAKEDINSTTAYNSSTLNLGLNYPSNWKVANPTSNSLSFTSDKLILADANNKKVSAKIVVTIIPQGQVPSLFNGNGVVAVAPSKLIAYDNPTPNQAAQTYISYLQYPTTTTVGGLDAEYITGNNGYLKTDSVLNSSMVSLSPLVSASFYLCQSVNCSAQNPLTLSSNAFLNSIYNIQIEKMFKSLVFN